jgi:hypothetical protein
VAYIREKKVPGKDGRSYSYFQLVEGKRVDGKVRQRVIAHLGKHPNIEAARAAAEALRHNEEEPSHIKRLKALSETYRAGMRHADVVDKEVGDLWYKLTYAGFRRRRSKAHKEKKKHLEERYADLMEPIFRGNAARDEAEAIYDSLSPQQQQRVRDENIYVVAHILRQRERHERSARHMAGYEALFS